MKNFAELLFHGAVTGATAAGVLFAIVSLFFSNKEYDPYSKVKKHYLIDEVEFTDPVPGIINGETVTTITFKINGIEKKKISSVFVDLEFYDSNGKFLFGHEHGTPWGEPIMSPKKEDHMSIEASIPPTIDFSKVSKVTADVFELVQE